METWHSIFWRSIAAIFAISALFYTAHLVVGLPNVVSEENKPQIDYSDVIVLLLTIVTVIFGFVATIMAIMGFVGYRNFIANARRHAESEVKKSIELAFKESGVGIQAIDTAIGSDDGDLRKWLEQRVRTEVIEMIPFFVDRELNPDGKKTELAAGQPTDEGNVE